MTPAHFERLERWSREPRVALVALIAGLVTLAALATAPRPRAGESWVTLIAPLGTGLPIAGSFTLSAPRRGEEHDVVFSATRSSREDAGARVELHVLDRGRWSGVRETESFGVAYEQPRSSADEHECVALRDALADALDAHDRRGLGPVDTIPLDAAAPSPPLALTLASLARARGLAAALALSALALALATFSRGTWLVGAYLFALGLVLRATALGLPFVRDQDVQRVLTGALPIGEILFGRGLSDRHPPLWFLVLHVVELAGQSPSIVRAPAVLTGACIGPAIVWAARERAGAGLSRMAAVLATLATVSSSLVASSREVSEIPFFTLVVIATVALLARADRAPTTINLAALATAHALVLSTYHLGVFVLAGLWLGRVVWRLEDARHSQRVRRAALVGVLLGLPALALAAHTFTVDLGAREAATLHPDRAWGEASVLGMFGASTTTTTDAIGVGTLLVALAFAIVDRACRPTTLAALVTLVGIALLAPVARVQPYYALTVAPLWLASIACTDRSSWTAPRRAAAAAAIAIAALVPIAIAFPALGALYTADADAVFGRYVLDAQRAHVDRIVAVAHYDATLLAYEEAQASSRRLDSSALDADAEGTLSAASTPRIAFLTRSHGEPQSSAESAAGRLRHFASRETIAVVVRDAFPMPEVDRLLEHCARLDASATTRLVLCDRDSFR